MGREDVGIRESENVWVPDCVDVHKIGRTPFLLLYASVYVYIAVICLFKRCLYGRMGYLMVLVC